MKHTVMATFVLRDDFCPLLWLVILSRARRVDFGNRNRVLNITILKFGHDGCEKATDCPVAGFSGAGQNLEAWNKNPEAWNKETNVWAKTRRDREFGG
jgi:hypothetical protein